MTFLNHTEPQNLWNLVIFHLLSLTASYIQIQSVSFRAESLHEIYHKMKDILFCTWHRQSQHWDMFSHVIASLFVTRSVNSVPHTEKMWIHWFDRCIVPAEPALFLLFNAISIGLMGIKCYSHLCTTLINVGPRTTSSSSADQVSSYTWLNKKWLRSWSNKVMVIHTLARLAAAEMRWDTTICSRSHQRSNSLPRVW